MAIENARLYEEVRANEERLEKELRFAQRVQAALLPAALPKRLKGVDVAARVRAGARARRRLPRLPVAGVEHARRRGRRRVGQGRAGGALQRVRRGAVRGRTFRRRYLPERSSPAGVLSSVNTILHQRQLEEYYCTLCYAVFDLKRRIVTLANSGLPYPIRCIGRRRARRSSCPACRSDRFQGSTYDEVTFALHAGDLFVFCTDGVFEAMNAQRPGVHRRRGCSRSSAGSRDLPPREDRRRHLRGGRRVPRRDAAERRHDRRRGSHHDLSSDGLADSRLHADALISSA